MFYPSRYLHFGTDHFQTSGVNLYFPDPDKMRKNIHASTLNVNCYKSPTVRAFLDVFSPSHILKSANASHLKLNKHHLDQLRSKTKRIAKRKCVSRTSTRHLSDGFSIKQEALIHFLLQAAVGCSWNRNYMDRQSDLMLMKAKEKGKVYIQEFKLRLVRVWLCRL